MAGLKLLRSPLSDGPVSPNAFWKRPNAKKCGRCLLRLRAPEPALDPDTGKRQPAKRGEHACGSGSR